jgi:DNA-damage-inducible protein D
MPEDLPAPEKSIKQLESASKKLSDKNNQESE